MKQSSVHYFNDLNRGKAALVNEFMSEYRNALQIYVKFIWSHVPKNWELPKYASYIDGINDLIISGQNSRLSAKVLQCAKNQAMQAVKSITNPMKKRAYVIRTRMSAGDDVRKLQRIQDREARKLLIDGEGIPAIGDRCNANLDSQMWDFQDYGTHGVVQLKCLENARLGSTYYGKIRIPVTYHRQYHKFKRIGVQKKTIAINNDRVHFIFDVPTPKKVKKKGRIIVGADQGIVTCLTLSDGQTTKCDRAGHDFRSIIHKISRKKKGSKAFQRAIAHRKNYINWAINRLDFSKFHEFRLEKLRHVRRGKKGKGRFLSHFAYPLIRDCVERRCNMTGVQFVEQNPAYRSQRCSNPDCGYVRASSRRGILFSCAKCGNRMNADFNASHNNAIDLPYITTKMRQLNLNRVGFYWKLDGFYDLAGRKFIVSDEGKQIFV